MKTYILGHQKPDTDAVIAAISLAYLYSQEQCFGYNESIPAITDPLNPETTFIFNKFGITTPQIISAKDISPEDQVVLVDHNEQSQRMEGLNPDQIVEIVDHHKANINFNNPIFMTFKTWGSTSTIVYYLMKQQNVTPDKTTASLMLSAILSDTVGYKSSTTTDQDRKFGAELAQIAGITDVEAFTLEIFKAKSDISKLSDEQIVTNDYKVFDFGKKTLINQIETVEQDVVLSRKADLLKAMESIKQKEGVDLIFCAVTDILKLNTKLICLGDKESDTASKAFGVTTSENIIDIGEKLSRKKDIAPPIEKALS